MISFLLDQGADPNSLEELPIFTHARYSHNAVGLESLVPSMCLLLRHIDVQYESAEEAAISVLGEFCGTFEEFVFLQQHFCPSFYQLSKQFRIRLALSLYTHSGSYGYPSHAGEIVRNIIGTDVLGVGDFNICYFIELEYGYFTSTLIHFAARHLGQHKILLGSAQNEREARSNYGAWSGLCHEFLRVVIALHHLVDGQTPFLSFLHGDISAHFYPGPLFRRIDVQVWVEHLEAAGVDLAEYGEAEKYVWKTQITVCDREFYTPNRYGDWMLQRMIGFTYGPSPTDWYVWLSEPSDHFAGEFWDMIERPVEVMPGAWPIE